MNRVIITESAKETKKIAANFAHWLFRCPKPSLGQGAVVIGLIGELGSGKTVFAQGFAKGLGIKENVVSPTFVLERVYKLENKKYKLFVHIDAYRLEKSKEMATLGFKDLALNPQNIILIEWADRIKNVLPKNYIKIRFEHINKNKRTIWVKKI
jgi:tRNA threonylcarbamoyladenosine biosynthesis protein TsaE